jgi:molybdate transport system substrate-binding protein
MGGRPLSGAGLACPTGRMACLGCSFGLSGWMGGLPRLLIGPVRLMPGAAGPQAPGQGARGAPWIPRQGGPAGRLRAAHGSAARQPAKAPLWKPPGTRRDPLLLWAMRGSPRRPRLGNFAAQIAQGAPFDLFLSADDRYPAQLVASGHADGARQRVYGLGQVVLWVRTQSPLDLGPGLQVLADARVRTVAMANPRHAPYGQAAEAALRAAGLHEAVAGKLVLGDNVSQAAQFVATGAADAGLIALSLARAPTFAAAGRFVVVSGHPPLRQTGVVLRAAADPAAAAAVLDALCGAEGRALLDRFGFLPPA